jgi:hypothetical protein
METITVWNKHGVPVRRRVKVKAIWVPPDLRNGRVRLAPAVQERVLLLMLLGARG